jgi:SAM-dependent methyltransferase
LNIPLHPLPLEFASCSRCGAWQQDRFLTEEEEAAFYDRYPNLAYNAPAWEVAFLAERMRRIERWRRPGRLLDVGCGRGYLVAAAVRRGWDAHGIEMSVQARSAALPEVAGRIRVSRLEELAGEDHVYDVVSLFHVLEHLRDPGGALVLLRRRLSPGGLLIIATPDAGSLTARLLARRWSAFRMIDHCVLYTAHALAVLLERSGYERLQEGAAGQPLAMDASAIPAGPALHAMRRRTLRLAGAWGGGRRILRRGVTLLGLGDALEVVARAR